MDARSLRGGLDDLIELADSVETTTRIYAARAAYIKEHRVVPTQVVVSQDVYVALLAESSRLMGDFVHISNTSSALRLFGMEVELVTSLPNGMFFMGEKE